MLLPQCTDTEKLDIRFEPATARIVPHFLMYSEHTASASIPLIHYKVARSIRVSVIESAATLVEVLRNPADS